MKKARIVYGIVVFCDLLMYFYTTYFYFLILFLMAIAFPFIVRLLLQIETSYIQFDFKGETISKVGKEMLISTLITSIHRLLVSGTIEYQIIYENTLLHYQKKEYVSIPLDTKQTKQDFKYLLTLCGEVTISLEDIYLYDVFKLCRIPLKCLKKQHLVIYPQELSLDIKHEVSSKPRQNGMMQYLYEKGNDVSEIYDLKDYVPGDDIRHVHWNLSAKTGQMLLKEGTRYSSYETVLLIDIGQYDQEDPLEPITLSSAIAYFMALSEQLLLQHIGHYVLFYDHGRFYSIELNNVQEYYQQMERWLSKDIPVHSGEGLHLFLSEQLDLVFSKMIYVTAGRFSKELSQLDHHLSVNAFTFRKSIDRIHALKDQEVQMIELPVDDLDQQVLHFDL